MDLELMVGAAEQCITPPLGTGLAGYFHNRPATAVHDDIFAKALVIERDGTAVVLIACDLIGISCELGEGVRTLVEERTDIPGSNVLICANHIHTGPEVRADRVAPRNEEWFATLPSLVAGAVCGAREAMRPARAFCGRTHEEGLAFNRRFRLPDSSEAFGTAGGTAIGAAGPTDPELQVIAFAGEDDEPFAIVSNYSLHIDVMGGTEVSGDYPGVMTEVLRGVYGPGLIHLFINGACGNINHVKYVGETHVPRKGPVKSRQIGRALAGAVINTVEKAEPSTSADVACGSEIVPIPFYPVNERVKAMVAEAKSREKPSAMDAYFVAKVEGYERDGKTADVEVQVVRIGDAAVVAVPGEYFVEWGLEIKKWSPMPHTLIAELANNWFGYIPTWEALGRGGYEATPIMSSQLAPGAGQHIADAAFRLLRQLA